MDFSNDRDYLAVPSRTFGTGTAYSISFWARVNSASRQWNMVLGQRGNTNFFVAANGQNNNLRWRSNNNASGTRQVDFNTGVNDTDWHHYVLVATSNRTLRLYLDGAVVSTSSSVQTGLIIDSIGAAYTDGDFDFQGQLDEVWIFDEALDATAVAGLYDGNDPGFDPPLSDPSVTQLIVILQAGQSNADGRAAPGDLPTAPINLQQEREEISFFYKVEGESATYGNLAPGLTETNGFGPEITLGDSLSRLYSGAPGSRVAIIKYANGGTNLSSQWKAGGDETTAGDGSEYRVFQETVNSGLSVLAARFPNAMISFGGMLWIQGESDGGSSNLWNAYEANLREFIGDIRATYGSGLPFFVSRLSAEQTAVSASGLAAIRQAQSTVANEDTRNFLIDTDGFGMKSDALHFDAEGQQAIGRATADLAAYALWREGFFSSAEIVSGLGDRARDADGDGFSNGLEFLASSDPLDQADTFRCTVSEAVSGALMIDYETSVLRAYAVQQLNLETLEWEEVLSVKRGTGELESRELPFSGETGIFRVSSDLP